MSLLEQSKATVCETPVPLDFSALYAQEEFKDCRPELPEEATEIINTLKAGETWKSWQSLKDENNPALRY